jgi:RNA polymerase sigma-70 factor (ECF subfamily)
MGWVDAFERGLLPPELAAAVVRACDSGRLPGIPLDDARYVAWLEARVTAEPVGAVGALDSLRHGDLWLACACAEAVPGALEAFQAELGAEIDRAWRRLRPAATEADDVRQLVLEKLFVGPDAKIASYGGRGSLRSWLRVVAARVVQNLATRGPRETVLDGEAIADLAPRTGDEELDRLRARYRPEFRAAYAAAAAALPVRDRVLLHQRFAERLTQPELAERYRVHVNTVARWLSHAQHELAVGIRAELGARLSLPDGEFTSLLKLVHSELDVSLGALGPCGDGTGEEP